MKLNERWQAILQAGRAMGIVLRRGVFYRPPMPARPSLPFRGAPVLRKDESGQGLCTVCGVCASECPTHCITIEQGENIKLEVDLPRCMYCGICAEVCPVQAIDMAGAP